jgi:titin
VLDVPGKPRQLTPDEVRAEHVKLSWLPPEDDGGTPITSYLVRYHLSNYITSIIIKYS